MRLHTGARNCVALSRWLAVWLACEPTMELGGVILVGLKRCRGASGLMFLSLPEVLYKSHRHRVLRAKLWAPPSFTTILVHGIPYQACFHNAFLVRQVKFSAVLFPQHSKRPWVQNPNAEGKDEEEGTWSRPSP